MRKVRVFAAAIAVALVGVPLALAGSAGAAGLPIGCATVSDWPMFGHDPGRSFASPDTCVSNVTAATLRPKWFFNTNAPVTAQPTIVGTTLYVGDFAGVFHALNTSDGSQVWSFDIHTYDNEHVDYSAIADSAAVAIVNGRKVVVFGGGATLFVLDAGTGALLAKQCLDHVDVTCQGASGITTEIESSPVVIPNGSGSADVLVGTDVNESDPAGSAGLYDLGLSAGTNGAALSPKWQFDPETGVTSSPPDFSVDQPAAEHGCGDIWSSPTIVSGLAVFGTGNCDQPNEVPPAAHNIKPVESTFGVSVKSGNFAWQATPHQPYTCDASGSCSGLDLDFGATPNALPSIPGSTAAVGEGGKDGVYYAYDRSGNLAWNTQVSTASDIGGMIGSTAVGKLGALHGNHPAVFAATAIPVSDADPQGSFQNDLQQPNQALGVHAIDAVTHQVVWDAPAGPAYGAAVYDNGVVFVPDTFTDSLLALDADTGVILRSQPLNAPPSSPVAVSGNSLYMGSGTTEQGASALSDPTALFSDPSGTAFGTLSGFGGVWGFSTTP